MIKSFKVIEVRFDTLTGNESEHVLLNTRFQSRADQKCTEANAFFKNRIKFKKQLESFAVVVTQQSWPKSKMPNLTKRQIVLDIFAEGNHKQNTVREIVQATLDAIQTALANGQNIELRNFGVFENQIRESRIGRNPNAPEVDIVIPRQRVVKFKPGKKLKSSLQKV